jgi:ABC-2 type transport system ATP-binding protein
MTPTIVADGLTKRYGARLAVQDVSFAVQRGEVMGLLGPNGSGKTTILRMLTGYLAPSSGRAEIAGLDTLTKAIAARQQVGYVPEDAPLYEGMRVGEFLRFMGAIKGLARDAARGAVETVGQRLSLDTVRDLPIGTLSKGFRQRVSIAQALLNQPPVLILDEPTNGLDPRQIIEMRDIIRSLADAHTIVLSSHILPEVEKIADRVAILVDGRLLAVRALRDRGGGRRLHLRVAGPPASVLQCLTGVPGVTSVSTDTTAGMTSVNADRTAGSMDEARHGARTYVVERDVSTSADRVAAALVGAGLALTELREEPVDLEALFLQLTGEHQAPVAGGRAARA